MTMPERDDRAAGGPVISVIVISYNTRDMTLDCLRSVVAETRVSHEVIVVDNASSDGSAEAIAAAFPNIRLIASEENLGFAVANNLAAREARGEYVLLLNPDTVVLNRALDKLVAFAQARSDARVWGGRTLYADGSLNATSCWGRMTLWSLFCYALLLNTIWPRVALFNPESYAGWPRDTVREVDIVTGCLLLMKRADWDVLAGFSPVFFMYGEDADLCLRARRVLGARPVITPEAEIIHYGGASEAVRADKMVRLLRAKVTLIRLYFPKVLRPLALWFLNAGVNNRHRAARLGHAVLKRGDAAVWAEIRARRGEWGQGFE